MRGNIIDAETATKSRRSAYNWYYRRIIRELVSFVIPSGSSVLEVGCGEGDLLASLPLKRGVGIDVSEQAIRNAKQKYPALEWRVSAAEHFTTTERFDYIVLSDVVGFFQDVEVSLRHLSSVAHSRTRVVLTYYNYLWEPLIRFAAWLGIKARQPLQHWLSKNDIVNLLYISGFETVKYGKRILVPVYIPLVSYFINRFIANLPLINRLCLIQYIIARPMSVSLKEYSVSIVIPARNERGSIQSAITRLPSFGLSQEVIFVEGHSTDGTKEEIERVVSSYRGDKTLRFTVQDGKGKGDAVRKGFAMATGDILMILDADLTVSPEELPKFYDAIRLGRGDFINGSRLVYPMEKEAMRFLNSLGNKFFSLTFSWLIGQNIKDTLCGTKVLFRSDYQTIALNRAYFGDFDPFGDFDLLLGAARLGLKIIDLPVHYKERVYGSTNISRFRHGLLLLRMCLFTVRKLKFQE